MKKINNLVIFGITLVLITSGGSLKINKNQDKFYNKVNKYTSEFQEDNYLVCAHRGFSSKEIENTSKSIKKANNSKYIDYIEMDVRMTQDNKFVLSHDDKLYNIDHFINISNVPYDKLLNCNYTYNEIKLGNLSRDGKFKIKRNSKLFNKKYKLTDMIDGINNSSNKNIILDLKIEDNNKADYIYNFINIIDNIDTSNIIIQSKNIDSLKRIKRLRPNLTYSAIIDEYSDFSEISEFENLTVKKNYINNPIIKNRIKNNEKVFVWTVNSEKSFYEVANYFNKDYDKIVYITDYPNEISYLLNNYSKILKKTTK